MSIPILDLLFARDGVIDPDLIGIHQARAADIKWDRARGESVHDFLARVVREAAAAGYRVVSIAGALQISNVIQLRRPMPPPYTDIVNTRNAQNRELERLGRAPSLEQQREIADIAERHRELFNDLELNLPQPGAQDRPRDYEVALLRRLQRFSHSFRDSDLARLAAAGGLARGIQEAIISNASAVAGDMTVGSFRRPSALREIRRADQTGQVTISFAGDPLSWMSAFMPATKTAVEGFNVPGRRR